MNKEGDIDSFINFIFRNEVKGVNSISFTSDEPKETIDLFKMLLEIFTKGCRILFSKDGKSVNLSLFSKSDVEKLQKYFLSFGIIFNWRKYHVTQVEKFLNSQISNNRIKISLKKSVKKRINNKHYDNDISEGMLKDYKEVVSNNLSDYRFRLIVGDDVYILFFKILE